MLNPNEVNQVVANAIHKSLKSSGINGLSSFSSEPTHDSDGKEALHITIVLQSGKKKPMSGDVALNMIFRIQRDLTTSGDDRFPIVDFVTEDELRADDDTQP